MSTHDTSRYQWLRQALAPYRTASPTIHPAQILNYPGVNQGFLDGPTFLGKPTQIFACWRLPEGASPDHPVPGIVLVPGGGATALPDWVELWNKRGFAAITMDICGCVPAWSPNPRFSMDWPHHPNGIPVKWGDFEHAICRAPEDQWPFHAAAAAVLAGDFLRQLPGVDAANVGIGGISWGGVTTLWAASCDTTYRFAIPVYGTGFWRSPESRLGTDYSHQRNNHALTPEYYKWMELWDPGLFLPGITMPCMFMSGTNDTAFPINTFFKSADTVGENAYRLCLPAFPHNHSIPDTVETLRDFAWSNIDAASPAIPRFGAITTTPEGQIQVAVTSPQRKITSAQLLYTRAQGFWPDRFWNSAEATLNAASGEITAAMPPCTTAAFINITDQYGSQWSSPLLQPPCQG